jgi:nucleoside-diphosphate-sugar epimerase
LSSIKVNGEETACGRPFTAQDAPAPAGSYGSSKWEAEQALRALADATGLELVITRPSLVYGPGVGGNFAQMVRWVARGIPLPLAAVRNKRTLMALPNLVDLIKTALRSAGAANQTLLAGDGEGFSTPQLLSAIGQVVPWDGRSGCFRFPRRPWRRPPACSANRIWRANCWARSSSISVKPGHVSIGRHRSGLTKRCATRCSPCGIGVPRRNRSE